MDEWCSGVASSLKSCLPSSWCWFGSLDLYKNGENNGIPVVTLAVIRGKVAKKKEYQKVKQSLKKGQGLKESLFLGWGLVSPILK